MSGKKTFMLHEPGTMAFAGKYNSATHRYAALKAATNGFREILLRQTNTKIVHRYTGSETVLKEPRVVKRRDREIVYSKKPHAVYEGSFEYKGAEDEKEEKEEKEVPGEAAEEASEAPGKAADKPKPKPKPRATKKAKDGQE